MDLKTRRHSIHSARPLNTTGNHSIPVIRTVIARIEAPEDWASAKLGESHLGVSMAMGVSQARWMVFVRGNPTKIRMNLGVPIYENPHFGKIMSRSPQSKSPEGSLTGCTDGGVPCLV